MIKIPAALITVISIILMLAGQSFADVWYVNKNTGNNGNSGTTSGSAWADIQFAINNASVMDGDTLFLTGTFDEIITVTKGLNIFGGTLQFNELSSDTNGRGIDIKADNVRLVGVNIEAGPTLTDSGVLLYAYNADDGLISGLKIETCLFTAQQRPAASPAITLAAIHSPAGVYIYDTDFAPQSGISSANHDTGLAFFGGQADGATKNQILNCGFSKSSNIGSAPVGGVGMQISPGQGDSAGKAATDFFLNFNIFHFDLHTGVLIQDHRTGALEGINNILMQVNGFYFNTYGLVFDGLANDPGAGISDFIFENSYGSYYFTDNDVSIQITQSGSGTSNIDFNTVRVLHCSIYGLTWAVENLIPSTTFLAEYNYWGPEGPVGKTIGGVKTIPYYPLSFASARRLTIDTPGDTGSVSISASNFSADIFMDLDPGITGETLITQYAGAYSSGYAGIISNRGIEHTIQFNSTLNDGEFIALLKFNYNQFQVLNTFGISSEDQIVIYYFNTGLSAWRPAVEGNTSGTPQWLGDSPAPGTISAADLGKHGVDTTANTAWAVVDHFTDFAGGEGLNGAGASPPSSVPNWTLH